MILHYQLTGQGPLVVLVHGLFGSLENLGGVARALSEHFQVLNVDVRNHGRSAHSDEMNYSLMAADLSETLDDLGLRPFAVLGHSMGGKLAMEFALRHPEQLDRLIVADIAPVSYSARHSTVFAGLNQVDLLHIANRGEADQQMAQHIVEPGVRQFLLKSLEKTDNGFRWRFNLAALQQQYPQLINAPQAGGQFNGKVLFIKGAESDYILPEHRPTILGLFPQAQAKIIQGTGHWLHAEKPSAFNKLVSDFLLT
ncbi:alpha/beta fold hydrolase [Rheinheimera sp. UJ63]|uniref:alpha/beta fold hydrolase n=1 Tax=Rheinheimera sp. UJ63 TaxID=2910157 RepID=UPI001F41875A|nr:alpha/beta fold hydrolase [Rheinheimera sp. UJ63]MCF4009852.1 alpha/beta fold hydrolase [Rheinheimera sp. UJ63]